MTNIIQGVDVSVYQGKIDWKKAKAAGVNFAILKIIIKSLNKDKEFENNYKGCIEAGVEIKGVYQYSYATTAAQAKKDAQAVIAALNGRKLKVWLDLEDKSLQVIKNKIADVIRAFRAEIESTGLEFGIYTGVYWYNTFIKPYISAELKGLDFWIANYGKDIPMKITDPVYRTRPSIDQTLRIWQYSSKGRIPGFNGNVDMNIYYLEDGESKSSVNITPPVSTSITIPVIPATINTPKNCIMHGQRVINAILENEKFTLEVNGVRDNATKIGEIKVLQKMINLDTGSNLSTDGSFGPKTQVALDKITAKRSDRTYITTFLETVCLTHGQNPSGVEFPGQFGEKLSTTLLKIEIPDSVKNKFETEKKIDKEFIINLLQ